MNQNYFFNQKRLRLAISLRSGEPSATTRVIRNTRTNTYLTINTKHWPILKKFVKGATLQEIIPQLIEERLCPELNDLYELIMRAWLSEILVSEDESKQLRKLSTDWRQWIRPNVGWFFVSLMTLLGFYAILTTPVSMPHNLFAVIIALICPALAWTASNALAACLLTHFDCDIYPFKLGLTGAIFGLSVDTREGQVLKKSQRLLIPLLLMAGPLGSLLMIKLLAPTALSLGTLVFLTILIPSGKGPARNLFDNLNRTPVESIYKDQFFIENLTVKRSWNNFKRNFQIVATGLEAIYTVVYLCVLALYIQVHVQMSDLLDWEIDLFRFLNSENGMLYGLITLATIFVTFPLINSLIAIFLIFQRKARVLKNNHVRVVKAVMPRKRSTHSIIQSIQVDTPENPLFKLSVFNGLSRESVMEIARHIKVAKFRRGEVIDSTEKKSGRVYMLYQGEIDITVYGNSGRKLIARKCVADEVFGFSILPPLEADEIAFKGRQSGVAFYFTQEEIFNVLVPALGGYEEFMIRVRESYLRHLDITRGWDISTLRYMATKMSFNTFSKGANIIRRTVSTNWFYLLFLGPCDVLKKGKRISILNPGSCMGEVDILRNTDPENDIASREGSMVLEMKNVDFIKLLARDYRAALYFERTASEKLGIPLFPLKGNRFSNVSDTDLR
ncbi:MAG: hypothetical protein JW739_07645 [Opitutales bacterium]|nr:hypothetical protein [Opitutales bacterium]